MRNIYSQLSIEAFYNNWIFSVMSDNIKKSWNEISNFEQQFIKIMSRFGLFTPCNNIGLS